MRCFATRTGSGWSPIKNQTCSYFQWICRDVLWNWGQSNFLFAVMFLSVGVYTFPLQVMHKCVRGSYTSFWCKVLTCVVTFNQPFLSDFKMHSGWPVLKAAHMCWWSKMGFFKTLVLNIRNKTLVRNSYSPAAENIRFVGFSFWLCSIMKRPDLEGRLVWWFCLGEISNEHSSSAHCMIVLVISQSFVTPYRFHSGLNPWSKFIKLCWVSGSILRWILNSPRKQL